MILSCHGRTTGEIKRLKECEEALTATEKTRNIDEFLRLQKDQRRAPADNFLELKNNIATFMGLVWVLFGSQSDYYKGLRNVYATMDLRDVMAIKSHFTAEHCRRIMWAIIDDGRSYFDNVKTTLDFQHGGIHRLSPIIPDRHYQECTIWHPRRMCKFSRGMAQQKEGPQSGSRAAELAHTRCGQSGGSGT